MPNYTADIQTRRFQCRHIFTDGHRCGSACLKGEDFCFYHHTARCAKPGYPRDPSLLKPADNSFILSAPADLSDRSGLQQAIAEVLNKLAGNEIDPRRAGLLLYGLQIASHNLPREKPRESNRAAEVVEAVTLDPIHGPIAPKAEVGEDEPEGPLARLLRKFDMEDAQEQQEREQRLAQRQAQAQEPQEAAPQPISIHAAEARPSTPHASLPKTKPPQTPAQPARTPSLPLRFHPWQPLGDRLFLSAGVAPDRNYVCGMPRTNTVPNRISSTSHHRSNAAESTSLNVRLSYVVCSKTPPPTAKSILAEIPARFHELRSPPPAPHQPNRPWLAQPNALRHTSGLSSSNVVGISSATVG